MAFRNGPLKAGAKFLNSRPHSERPRLDGEFTNWLIFQAKAGHEFKSLDEARAEFEQRKPQA